MKSPVLLIALVAASALSASPAAAQTARDPASVPLPAAVELQLKLGSEAVIDRFGAAFDLLASGAGIPVVGPGATLAIRAAADRARVFLAYTQYDLDGDGTVSRAEFDTHAQIAWGGTLGDSEFAILDREWAQTDLDRDNVVNLSEIHALALTMHPVPDSAPLSEEAAAMLSMDLNNDAFVTWDEVESVLTARKP